MKGRKKDTANARGHDKKRKHDDGVDLEESSEESLESSDDDEFLDELENVLDQFSDASDDDGWNSEVSPQKKKSSGPSSASPSPAKSSEQCGKVEGRRGSATGSCEHKWRSVDEPDFGSARPVFRPKKTPGPQLVSNDSCSALHYFEMFFSTSVLNTIVANTNAYGAIHHEGKKTPWQDITVQDFRSFLALVIYMGLQKCTKLTDYWKKSDSLPYPAQVMSARKFVRISSALHLSDPKADLENEKKKGTLDYDHLCRIRPLYQDIRDACRASFHPFQNISIDERMVVSKARHGLKQYMKNKPTRRGYKLLLLADSQCGYTWDFLIHEGRVKSDDSRGISYDSVMMLVDERLLGSGYKLFVDNFYTSPKLFRDLLAKKIWACGTVRANRIGHLKKQAPRGNIRWFREDCLLIVEWKDKRDVLMCSTFHKAFNGDTIKRSVRGAGGDWVVQEFPVPAAVLDYNKHMGGVDLSDALIGDYTVLHKMRKWYRSFFYHFVDIAVTNAFVLHQHVAIKRNKKPLSQKAFREALVAELAKTGSASVQKLPSGSEDSHRPKYISGNSTFGRRRCRICSLKTPIVCMTCDVSLCFVATRDCYNSWHERDRGRDSEDE